MVFKTKRRLLKQPVKEYGRIRRYKLAPTTIKGRILDRKRPSKQAHERRYKRK